jgi:hypothetical protein
MNPQASLKNLEKETLAPGRNFYLFGQSFKFTVIIVCYCHGRFKKAKNKKLEGNG